MVKHNFDPMIDTGSHSSTMVWLQITSAISWVQELGQIKDPMIDKLYEKI